MGKYDDIIHLSSPGAGRHPRMSLHDRAAQFSPFAALSGYGDALKEDDRLTEDFVAPDSTMREELDRRFLLLAGRIAEKPMILVTYFIPDTKKEGGTYATLSQRAVKLRQYEEELLLEDGIAIPLGRIVALEGDLFTEPV